MIKNPPSLKLNSFHYPNIPKSKPLPSSPYEKHLPDNLTDDSLLKTQNKVSDIKRNLSDVFNNISTKTKGARAEKSRPVDEMDADYLFENFEEIFEVHQNNQTNEEIQRQIQQAQSNMFIIRNLGRTFEEAAREDFIKVQEIAAENQRKKILEQKKIEEENKKNLLNYSVYEAPKAKIMASNEYYKNFLTKLTENHCEGCSCLNCKVFEVVSQNKRPKYGHEEYHKRMKTEIFQFKELDVNVDEEKEFQKPTTHHLESDTSILIKESLRPKSSKDQIRKGNENVKGRTNTENENNSFYSNACSIDLGNKQENDSFNKNRNCKNGEKRIFYKRKMGLPPLNKKNQSILYQPNLFFKPSVSNNNNMKRSISTGIPKRMI